jgi:hypothetical protein
MPFLIIVINSLISKEKREAKRFYDVGCPAEKDNKSKEYSLVE